jgi:hypothetical protein
MSSAVLPKPFPVPARTGIIRPKPLRQPDPRAKLLWRKALSIAVAVVYDQGIVFCADTKITTNIKLDESKIEFLSSGDRAQKDHLQLGNRPIMESP